MAVVERADLAARFSRMGILDLHAVVSAPAGTFTEEALALAQAELKRRPATEEPDPAETVEESTGRPRAQPRLRTFFGVALMISSALFLAPGVLQFLLLPLEPTPSAAIFAVAAVGAGALLLFFARKLDLRFWSHAPKALGISGFGLAGMAAAQLASAGVVTVELVQRLLEGIVTCIVASAIWFLGRRQTAAGTGVEIGERRTL